MCGAERLRDETRALLRKKYAIELLEGYGVTEAAPVISANQPGANRSGTVGHLMADMEARLDPVEGIPNAGRLFVKGPNVMLGYIKPDAPGVIQPPEGGWHDTGDVVSIDEDGYIAIKGRLKRFAKIGGETVSLAVVESIASALWPDHYPRRRRRARRTQGRTDRARDDEAGRRSPRPGRLGAQSRRVGARRAAPDLSSSTTFRCSAPARRTMSRFRRSPMPRVQPTIDLTSELRFEFFDRVGLGLRRFDPFQHVGKIEDRVAVVGADPVELHVIGDEARAHRRVHRVGESRLLAEQVRPVIGLQTLAPDRDDAVDVELRAGPHFEVGIVAP